MLFKRAPHGVRFFFAPFKKLVRQIFFAYFLPNLPNKKFSGIFFWDFFIFFPPFAARRRLKCKIFTVSRARVVKKFNGRKFYENKFFSGEGWQVLASLKCRKYFFSDMQCVFFLVGAGVLRFLKRSGGVSVFAGAQCVIRFCRRSGGLSVSAGAQGAFFRVSFQPSFRKKLHS